MTPSATLTRWMAEVDDDGLTFDPHPENGGCAGNGCVPIPPELLPADPAAQ